MPLKLHGLLTTLALPMYSSFTSAIGTLSGCSMSMQAKSRTLLPASVIATVTIRLFVPHSPWLDGPLPEAAISLNEFRRMFSSVSQLPTLVAQAAALARLVTKFWADGGAAGSVPS